MADIENAPPPTDAPTRVEGVPKVHRDADEAEFDAILEQAAPTIAEMARQAREMRRAGLTRKFPD